MGTFHTPPQPLLHKLLWSSAAAHCFSSPGLRRSRPRPLLQQKHLTSNLSSKPFFFISFPTWNGIRWKGFWHKQAFHNHACVGLIIFRFVWSSVTVNVLRQKSMQTYLLIQLNSADLRRHSEGRSLGTGQLFHNTLVSFCPLSAATTKSKQVILIKDERKCKLLRKYYMYIKQQLLFCNFDQIWYSLWWCHLGLCHGWHFWRTS